MATPWIRDAWAQLITWQTAFAGVWVLVCMYCDAVMQAWIELYPLQWGFSESIPDAGFELLSAEVFRFPAWMDADVMLAIVSVTGCLRSLFEKDRFMIIRRYALLQGVMFLMRALTISVRIQCGPDDWGATTCI